MEGDNLWVFLVLFFVAWIAALSALGPMLNDDEADKPIGSAVVAIMTSLLLLGYIGFDSLSENVSISKYTIGSTTTEVNPAPMWYLALGPLIIGVIVLIWG